MDQQDNSKWKKYWDNSSSSHVTRFDQIEKIYFLKRDQMLELFEKFSGLDTHKNKDFLDLGAGTGNVSFYIQNKYRDACAILIDGSKAMLEKAKKKANEINYKIKTIYQDLADPEWVKKSGLNSKYSLIISSLALHHLNDKGKARIFKDIYNLLTPKGRFIYLDVVDMESDINDFYIDLFLEEIINNMKKYGETPLSFEEEKKNYFIRTKEQGDMPSSVNFILKNLKSAGFKKSGLIWYYVIFGMFLAIK